MFKDIKILGNRQQAKVSFSEAMSSEKSLGQGYGLIAQIAEKLGVSEPLIEGDNSFYASTEALEAIRSFLAALPEAK